MTLAAHSVLGHAFLAEHRIELPGAKAPVLTELNGEGCVLCSCVALSQAVRDELTAILGIALPQEPGVAAAEGGRWAIWLTPHSWLVRVEVEHEVAIVEAVQSRFPDRMVHASRYSDSLCWLLLEGDGAERVLRQGGFLSLEPGGILVGAVKRVPVADVPIIIWRQAIVRWRLGVERSRAAWFVDWMRNCCEMQEERP